MHIGRQDFLKASSPPHNSQPYAPSQSISSHHAASIMQLPSWSFHHASPIMHLPSCSFHQCILRFPFPSAGIHYLTPMAAIWFIQVPTKSTEASFSDLAEGVLSLFERIGLHVWYDLWIPPVHMYSMAPCYTTQCVTPASNALHSCLDSVDSCVHNRHYCTTSLTTYMACQDWLWWV
jgi:hypothetical protein